MQAQLGTGVQKAPRNMKLTLHCGEDNKVATRAHVTTQEVQRTEDEKDNFQSVPLQTCDWMCSLANRRGLVIVAVVRNGIAEVQKRQTAVTDIGSGKASNTSHCVKPSLVLR